MRSVVAVLAGLVANLAVVMITTNLATTFLGIPLDGQPTSAYLLVHVLGTAVGGLLGGAVAIKLAPHTPHGHVFALAAVILLLSLPSLFATPAPGEPEWYHPVVSVLGPLSVLGGGLLGRRWRRTA